MNQRNTKKKKDDLTDEIKKFLSSEISLFSIKRILLKCEGYKSEFDIEKSDHKFISIRKTNRINEKHTRYEFLVYVYMRKSNLYSSFTINSFGAYSSTFYSIVEMDTSLLKQQLFHKIYNWLSNNLSLTYEIHL